MTREEFHKMYGLTVEIVAPVVAEKGFDFDEFYKKHGLLFAEYPRKHTFPAEKDFSGKIELVLLKFPATQEVDTSVFTRNAKKAGYFFVGLKGVMLAHTQASGTLKMFMPDMGMIIPHREIEEDDYMHSKGTDIPILCYDGMIKYSSDIVNFLLKRKKPYGILLGRVV